MLLGPAAAKRQPSGVPAKRSRETSCVARRCLTRCREARGAATAAPHVKMGRNVRQKLCALCRRYYACMRVVYACMRVGRLSSQQDCISLALRAPWRDATARRSVRISSRARTRVICPDQGPSRAPRAATEWLKRALWISSLAPLYWEPFWRHRKF